MNDLTSILHELTNELSSSRPAALCVLVGTKGSTPQQPGATMLVRADRSIAGTLGGGCVEEEVKEMAQRAIEAKRPAWHDFLLNQDYGWDDTLLCGGRMEVAIVPFTTAAELLPIEHALAQNKARQPAFFPIVIEREDRRLEYRLHLEPAPTLLLAGAGHVSQAVAKLAVDLGFHVVVFDDRAEYAAAERFDSRVECVVGDIAEGLNACAIDANCYVVIVTRGHHRDQAALEAVIRSPAAYLGLIGSKRKAKVIFKELAAAGVPQDQLDRVHTPIGLPIGAVTVPEIAVSIAAELIQHRRQTTRKVVEGPLPARDSLTRP